MDSTSSDNPQKPALTPKQIEAEERLANTLECARDYCGDVPVEVVLRPDGWPIPIDEWFDACNAWRSAHGLPLAFQAYRGPAIDRGAVGHLRTKLFVGIAKGDESAVDRITKAAKVGEYDFAEAADFVVRTLFGRGLTPLQIKDLSLADIAVLVTSPKKPGHGGRPRKWDSLLSLYDKLQRDEPGISQDEVCKRWRQHNPRKASELPRDIPNARTLQNAISARLRNRKS